MALWRRKPPPRANTSADGDETERTDIPDFAKEGEARVHAPTTEGAPHGQRQAERKYHSPLDRRGALALDQKGLFQSVDCSGAPGAAESDEFLRHARFVQQSKRAGFSRQGARWTPTSPRQSQPVRADTPPRASPAPKGAGRRRQERGRTEKRPGRRTRTENASRTRSAKWSRETATRP